MRMSQRLLTEWTLACQSPVEALGTAWKERQLQSVSQKNLGPNSERLSQLIRLSVGKRLVYGCC